MSASVEVLTQANANHDRRCANIHPDPDEPCPCGTAHAIVCGFCDEPVYVALVTGWPCVHARAMGLAS